MSINLQIRPDLVQKFFEAYKIPKKTYRNDCKGINCTRGFRCTGCNRLEIRHPKITAEIMFKLLNIALRFQDVLILRIFTENKPGLSVNDFIFNDGNSIEETVIKFLTQDDLVSACLHKVRKVFE